MVYSCLHAPTCVGFTAVYGVRNMERLDVEGRGIWEMGAVLHHPVYVGWCVAYWGDSQSHAADKTVIQLTLLFVLSPICSVKWVLCREVGAVP